MMTIDRQIEDMTSRLPTWAVKRVGKRTAVWTGTLTPYNTSYVVRIEHTVPPVIEYRSLLYIQPLIEVMRPQLVKREGNAEGPLPHVYWRHPRTDRPGPFLCVFDAEAREWTLSDALSETTVPFTLHWLQSYEAWVETGRWLGLGRHSGEERTGAEFKRHERTGPNPERGPIDRHTADATTATAMGAR